jgi:Predicted dehydrogenases and related proteins
MRIKIAVIGCGAITRLSHLPSLLQNPGFELVALVDPDLDAGRRLNQVFGISVPVKIDIRDLPPTDAAVVAVPPHLHHDLCTALLRKGIHVLCEKPMATDVAQGEGMVKAARAGKAVLLVGMQKQYCPNTLLLKEILKDGMLGKIKGFKLISAVKSQWDTANLNRFNPDHSKGGVLFESGIHWIYRVVYWFGTPKRIRYADDRIDGVEVNALIDSDFDAYEQEIHGSLYFSWDHKVNGNRITVRCEKGVAEVSEDDNTSVYIHREIHGGGKIMEIRNHLEKEKADLFALQLDRFAACIEEKEPVPETTVVALDALRFVEECYLHRVAVPQPWVYQGIDQGKRL